MRPDLSTGAHNLKKSKPSGLRKYWRHLTLKECEIERQKLYDKQGGKCYICGKPESHFTKRLAVDHNHKTGRVRGLLCFRCNKFQLGRHTIESIVALLIYLADYDVPLKRYKRDEVMPFIERILED